MEFTAHQIATFLGGEVEGNQSEKVSSFAKIEEANKGELTFLYNPKYKEHIFNTKASIVLVNKDLDLDKDVEPTLVRVENAYESLAKLLQLYADAKPKKTGIENNSHISESAKLGDNCYVGAFAYVSDNAVVGNNVTIQPHVFIGEGAKIGDNTILYSGAKIYEGCKIGKNCTIHSGAVIGADGFGFAQQGNQEYAKIPQIGIVILGDNVEVGANTCIDRSTMGTTEIADGCKLDNLVQIGHNVIIGENTILCGQVGIAGSSKLGKNIIMAGQSGVAGHLEVGDGVVAGAKCGIVSTVGDNEMLMGMPHMKAGEYRRSHVLHRNLPKINNKVSQIEKDLKRLKEAMDKE